MVNTYTADFETTTDLDDCRIWAAAVCQIGEPYHIDHGTSIEWYLNWCYAHAPCTVYFHNLGFDGAFIMDYLLHHGWKWVATYDEVKEHTFTTIISDANQIYCITLYFDIRHKIRIYDSLKIVPLSISQMAKAYKLPILKGELDYEAYREPGHELTDEEIAYIDNDVKIAAMVMNTFLNQGLKKMTAGSNALNDYQNMVGGLNGFRRSFPMIDNDDDMFIRKAYKGGFTYADSRFVGKRIGDGVVFDVNSLYPSVMYGCSGEKLPYGRPMWFSGKPKDIPGMPLWIAQITCCFRLRERHIPCIQLKGNFRFKQSEYLDYSKGEVTFTITNVDWELIKQQYHIYNLRWHGGFYFKGGNFMFKNYIDKWIKVKNDATIEGNSGQRQIAKLMLNSLYGKFATRTEVYSRKPELKDGVLHYVDLDKEERKPVYLPVGVFVTAWARFKTITSAQKVYDRFIYADTDSMHLMGTEIPDTIEIDDVKLGAWKHETTFYKAKFLRAKCYIEYEVGNDKPTVHVAGMPAYCHDQVNINNFKFGAEYEGKLYTKRVKGGIVLVPDKFQIRE